MARAHLWEVRTVTLSSRACGRASSKAQKEHAPVEQGEVDGKDEGRKAKDVRCKHAQQTGEEKEAPKAGAFAFWVLPDFFIRREASDEASEETDTQVDEGCSIEGPYEAAQKQ